MSFTCRLLNRGRGRWLHTRTPVFCAVALACKARTDLHYSLPLTIDDVGIAGCTTTCSFVNRHSRPEPVLELHYFRASLGRYPRQSREQRRPNLPGLTVSVDSAKCHGSIPFPPLPTVSSARPLIKIPAETESQESFRVRERTGYYRFVKYGVLFFYW